MVTLQLIVLSTIYILLSYVNRVYEISPQEMEEEHVCF